MGDALVSLESTRALTAAEFQRLTDVPAAAEWFSNLGNAATRRAYENALKDFVRFTGIARADEFCTVTRAHVIAWRDELVRSDLGATSIRHRLSRSQHRRVTRSGRTSVRWYLKGARRAKTTTQTYRGDRAA
jgi:Phage integrase, N-terminal SAM-like domain